MFTVVWPFGPPASDIDSKAQDSMQLLYRARPPVRSLHSPVAANDPEGRAWATLLHVPVNAWLRA